MPAGWDASAPRYGWARLMDRFDLLGPLPGQPSTTVIEASAGTGKTFTLASLVTRYVAEGGQHSTRCCSSPSHVRQARSFGSWVRSALIEALRALEDPGGTAETDLLRHLTAGSPEEFGSAPRPVHATPSPNSTQPRSPQSISSADWC